MSDYPDYNNEDHRDCIERNLENAGDGVIAEGAELIRVMREQEKTASRICDDLRTQLAAANERLKELTERAERAEKVVAECEASGFVTKNGEARKVNGTLCLDDDGVIIADGATVYFVDEFGDIVEYDCRGIEGGIPSGLFWSTRDALEVARKQGGRA